MKKTIQAALAASLGLFGAGAGQAQNAPPPPPMPVPMPPPMPRIQPMPVPMPPAPPMPVAPPSLRDSFVYIYNFLDVREAEYGDKVLAQFDRQLIEALGKSHAGARVLRFRDSPVMRQSGQTYTGVTNVPVAETIIANLADERAMGARYRLIVFPSSYSLAGAWRFYEVRWMLMDIRTGRRVWSYLYKGKHMVMWRTNENSEARGRKLVNAAWSELQKAGLL